MKTVVIGDIHGGLKALKQVLAKVENPEKTRYIFVGDYVDGWSDSAETIRYLIAFEKTHSCILIRGNHDELLYNYLKNGDDNPMWLAHGGASTLENYKSISKKEKQEHLRFLSSLRNYFIDDKNRLFVHAGFFSMHGPQHEYLPKLMYWDRTLWEMVCAMDPELSEDDPKYPKRLQHFKEIFIGHTPVTRLGSEVPLNFANVWNVDTGAGFKGRITMMDVDSKEIWQSDPVFELYRNEIGRN